MIKSVSTMAVIALLGTGAAFAQTSVSPKQMLMSDVYDQSVYDKGQHKLGKVDNLVIEPSGAITSALVSVGGLLGVGEKTVAVPFHDITMVAKDGKSWLQLDRTTEQLKAAPAFDAKATKK